MSARSRRQTRSRRFDLPSERWPLNHNAAVYARKHPRPGPSLGDVAAALVAFGQMGAAFEEAVTRLGEAAAATSSAFAEMRETALRTAFEQNEATLNPRRADIRRRYATLDRLALNGYDVRDEMDALAIEEAALNLEAAGITEPEALATANRAVAEFELTHPKEKTA
ncbi:hypothetical protein ACF1AJ_20555 [Leifsonia sp. NPDC014704]|uniref:hypothetical protein n=1 Tax=Leifsonia sp. NPDC014704 TaxID=3364123 RepID=UPI0036F4AA61